MFRSLSTSTFFMQGLRLSGWKLLAVGVAGAVFLLVAVAALLTMGLAVIMLLGVGVLHGIYLPRLAHRVGLSALVLSLLLLPILVVVTWAIMGGPQGVALGLAGWIAVIAAPQLALRALARRLQRHRIFATGPVFSPLPASARPPVVLEAVKCRQCGWTRWSEAATAAATCPQCGQSLSLP